MIPTGRWSDGWNGRASHVGTPQYERQEATMTAYSPALFCSAALLLLVEFAITTSATPMASAGPSQAQVTILYDAFGKDSVMQKDWGYAALVEYGGKRIL